jgi:hypothetical protein
LKFITIILLSLFAFHSLADDLLNKARIRGYAAGLQKGGVLKWDDMEIITAPRIAFRLVNSYVYIVAHDDRGNFLFKTDSTQKMTEGSYSVPFSIDLVDFVPKMDEYLSDSLHLYAVNLKNGRWVRTKRPIASYDITTLHDYIEDFPAASTSHKIVPSKMKKVKKIKP